MALIGREEIAQNCRMIYSKENMIQKYKEEYDKGGKKEKILIIDVNCKNSSTGKIVYELYQNIRADGRQVAICYGRGPLIKEENIYKFGVDCETAIHAALARVTGYNGCFSPISTLRLIRYIEKYKPDVIHLHELHAYFVNIKMLINYIKRKQIPVVWTFHCEYMYTGKCGHAYECLKFQQGCGKCPLLKEYPKSIFFDKTRQMLKQKRNLLENWKFTIVTPSQWSADRVKRSFLKDKNIRVIHNGVDINVFKPANSYDLKKKLKISQEYKVALFVAPNVSDKRKGGYWILKVAEELRKQKIIFLMVGGGEKNLSYPENVRYIGPVYNQKELAAYYSLSDIFLLCSERETYSMTCAESLCCGTPVVGFKCGAPETIFKEPYAKFIDYGNVPELCAAITAYLNFK